MYHLKAKNTLQEPVIAYRLKVVHQAVKNSNDLQSGITIHLVNEEYDKGEILLQEKINIDSDDTPEMIAEKVHELEYKFYPNIIEEYFEKHFKL